MSIKTIWPKTLVKISVPDGLGDILLAKNHTGSHLVKAGVCLLLGVGASRHQLLLSLFDDVGQLSLQVCRPHDCLISIILDYGLNKGRTRTQLCHPLDQ